MPSKTRRRQRNKSSHRRTRIKKGGKQSGFKKLQCAPKKDKLNEFSCYSDKDLNKMKDLWNARHKDIPIVSTDARVIWSELKNKMANACYNEACWLKQKFMENNLDNGLLNSFAPKSPQKWKERHTTWLNSTDIEKVMKQYEYYYPNFRFIGPTPIDFDSHIYNDTCVWDDLCQFDIATQLKAEVNKIGIIFNTDPHTKGGAHWISLFIDLEKKFIFFFDSNGTKMPKEIDAFCNRVMDQAKKEGIKLKFDQNAPFAHQEGNTECGMYSLYFIISLLTEKHNYNFFKKTKISDEAMEHLRDVYFNSNL
jgi:hypothetical protein